LVKLAMVVAVLGACVAESDDPSPPDHSLDQVSVEDVASIEQEDEHHARVCSAASALPPTDVCSLVCDPDAFKARLVGDGMKSGNCYQVRCTLAPDTSVTVGVCIP
jgi:hypothetical protein